jgi:hypothetical protein
MHADWVSVFLSPTVLGGDWGYTRARHDDNNCLPYIALLSQRLAVSKFLQNKNMSPWDSNFRIVLLGFNALGSDTL